MMKNVKLDIAKTGIEISADIEAKAQTANALLHSGKGAGNDFLGWVHLPSSISENEIDAIRKEAAKLRSKADVVVCIGIGGSYLGAKAVLEAMSDPFKLLHKEQKDPTVIFAGQNISEDYTAELLAALKEHSIAAIVISKSGTTTEPAIAFRLIKAEIEKRYGKKEAAERIVAITDRTVVIETSEDRVRIEFLKSAIGSVGTLDEQAAAAQRGSRKAKKGAEAEKPVKAPVEAPAEETPAETEKTEDQE